MKILKSILIGIGKYLLGFVLVVFGTIVFLSGTNDLMDSSDRYEYSAKYEYFFIAALLIPPILMVLNKNIFKGFLYMAVLCLAVNFALPTLGITNGSPYPGIFQKTGSRSNGGSSGGSSNQISGTYSDNTGGAITTITIAGNSWYGEHREETTGALLGSSFGSMDGNDIIDEYGNKIGTVKNGRVRATIGGESVSLNRN